MTKSIHTVMSALVDEMLAIGIPASQIWELGADFDRSGNGNTWRQNEQPLVGNGQSSRGYWWTDPITRMHQKWDGRPVGHYLHHTASHGYTPNVKNSHGQTKANAYAGLLRGTRLYAEGGGTPTIALASAGPADYSAGKNNDELIKEFFVNQLRFIGRQTKADTTGFYGNRHVWNTEVVLDGTGTAVDFSVRELLIAYCAAISNLLGKNAWIHGGHGQGSKRKIDLWDGRYRDMAETIFTIQTDTLLMMDGGAVLPEPPPEENDMYVEVKYGDGFKASRDMQPAVAGWQGTMKLLGNPDLNSQEKDGIDGIFGSGTRSATKKTQAQIGVAVTGIADSATRVAAERYLIDR